VRSDYVHYVQVPILGSFTDREPNSVVVMDNASIHHDPRITDLIQNAGAVCIYLPPYSPDFNPIELVFGWVKLHMKRHFHNCPIGIHHIGALMGAFSTIGEQNMRAYFQHCGLNEGGSGDEEEEEVAAALLIALLASD
jgi:hypothetical protein